MEDLFGTLIFLAFLAFSVIGRASRNRQSRGETQRQWPQPPTARVPRPVQPGGQSPPAQQPPGQPSTRNWPSPPQPRRHPWDAAPQRAQPAAEPAPSIAGERAGLEGRQAEGIRTEGFRSEGVRSEGVRSEGFRTEGPDAGERLRTGDPRFRRLEDRIPDEFEVTEFGTYQGLETGLQYREVPGRRLVGGVPVNISDDLADPERVAEAIVLAEVLGPPLAKRRSNRWRL